MSKKFSLMLLPLLLAGCARYEYQLLSPAKMAGVIGYDQSKRLALGPLVYDLRSYENHLILRIENPSADPIKLQGDQSFVVSPDGQSHPLVTQMIASHSFIKLILPPVQPAPEPSGPSITFGLGYTTGSAAPVRPVLSTETGTPYYFYIGAGDGAGDDWEWTGQTDVRLELVFSQGDRVFHQKFIFRRQRV